MDIKNQCKHPDFKDKLCWISVFTNPGLDIEGKNQVMNIQDEIALCYECEHFKNVTYRGFGRREADKTIAMTIVKLMEQLAIKKQNLQQIADRLQESLEQLSLLNNITDTLARSDKLEKSLRIILTGVTSGDAYRFNRAGIFLVNEKTNMLDAKCAIGPHNVEEATRIWSEISKIPIDRLLEEILIEDEFIPCSMETAISDIKMAIKDENNPLIHVIKTAKETIINVKSNTYSQHDFSWWPMANQIAIVPLVSEGKTMGLIMADNAITGKEITLESIEALKSLANACAPGLNNAILQEKLRAQIHELERMNELIKSNQAYLMQHERLADIGTLASKTAHEFRIPLVAIGGYARRILKTYGTDKFDPRMVEIIIEEVDRLTNITSEILEYSRISKLNIKECDVNNIIQQSLNHLERKLAASGIKTEQNFGQKDLRIKADPEKLKQVILNLIDNAVDAMNGGGKLKVKTSRQSEYVVLEISDTGEGIDKNDLDNLFNLFYTTKNRGTGLGLPVSKKIIDDHGGNIVINSTPGKGSVFSIRLPAT